MMPAGDADRNFAFVKYYVVVELQTQEKKSCKKLLGTGTRTAGQI